MVNGNFYVKTFLAIAKKYKLQEAVHIHGSIFYGAPLTPYWSDIDATVSVKSATKEVLGRVRKMKAEYLSKYPEIPLSLTVLEEADSFENNYFHHHGVKPMSYNSELALQCGHDIPFKYHFHVERTSSVYRYYEILFTFRRGVINNPKFTANMVSSGYHRLSRFLRTQAEILHPEMVLELGKIFERNVICMLRPKNVINKFFKNFDSTKLNWERIRLDDAEIQKQGEYLIETFARVHEAFLPRLKELGEQYAEIYS